MQVGFMDMKLDRKSVYAKEAEICARLNDDRASVSRRPKWLKKRYSVPRPKWLIVS
jgi:hypothetical protein